PQGLNPKNPYQRIYFDSKSKEAGHRRRLQIPEEIGVKMASACNRFFSRASSPSIRSAFRSKFRNAPVNGSASSSSSTAFHIPNRSISSPIRRFSLSRLPSELGCAQSLLPLHSAVAAARMTSCLSSTLRSCRALSQGTLCCTYPGL
ncbi:hypothetical protein RJ641_035323, partial [Dillenia turbinata]